MKKYNILYISTNDGSDTRINKEIRSLSDEKIVFVGIGNEDNCFIKHNVQRLHLIPGKSRQLSTLVKYWLMVIRLLVLKSWDSVHIVNEEALILFYPFLFKQHVVLDLFDSLFLKLNIVGERMSYLKAILYWPADVLLVTDENRYELLPSRCRSKTLVLPNYPDRQYVENVSLKKSDTLTIMYMGWLGRGRGTEIIEGLLMTSRPVRIIAAGWFSDEYTRHLLSQNKQVEYMGIIPQKEAIELTMREGHYLMCCYAPINENNVNASPNKIYDAIQADIPVIINREVKISKWIAENKCGMVIDTYGVEDFNLLYDNLRAGLDAFHYPPDWKARYSWQQISPILLKAHSIS